MKDILSKLCVVAGLVFGSASSRAAVTDQTVGGVGPVPVYGEAFQTPTDLLDGTTTPNFYLDAPAIVPVTGSTAFLLSMQFTGTPTALSPTPSGFLTESLGVAGFEPLAKAGNFSMNGIQASVPLPEPSSQTAFYVLSGIVGLGFVVMRRRTVA